MIWQSDKLNDSGQLQEPGSVNITEWWRQMEMKVLEAVVFKDARIEPVSAMRIAPWIAPSCRADVVVNTEYLKNAQDKCCSSTPVGCPKMLAELIRKGTYNPLNLQSASTQDLQKVCTLVGIPHKQASTKVRYYYILFEILQCHNIIISCM